MKLLNTGALCAAIIASAGLASGQTFSYNADHDDLVSLSAESGTGYKFDIAEISEFSLVYNSDSQLLDFSATYNNSHPDGFWFVLSDGPNPKNHVDEYAIFYFDASQPSPIVSAFVYDGENNASSFSDPAILLDSSLNSDSKLKASVDGNKFSFTADVSDINDAALQGLGDQWQGAQFGDTVGIWFHTFTLGGETTYDENTGALTSLPINRADFFDTANQQAVPEPSSMLLSLVGTLLLFRRKR